MPHVALLTYYCVFILLASIAGGMIPVWFRLTHRWMQFAVSFVAGLMLGVGLLHMLPHAIADAMLVEAGTPSRAVTTTMWWMLGGFLAMFFIERFFCYHHHDVPGDGSTNTRIDHGGCDAPSPRSRARPHHDVTWSGAALGLFLHSLLNGVALAASVANSHGDSRLAGLGTFLVDLPAQAVRRDDDRHADGPRRLFARLAAHGQLPVLAGDSARRAVFYFGLASADGGNSSSLVAAYALAFSAGTFLCIASSDLLARTAIPSARPRQAVRRLAAGSGRRRSPSPSWKKRPTVPTRTPPPPPRHLAGRSNRATRQAFAQPRLPCAAQLAAVLPLA